MEPENVAHLTFTDDSDEEIHPNIDRNSFIRWKRMNKQKLLEEKKHKLKEFKNRKDLTEEEMEEVKRIEIELEQPLKETDKNKEIFFKENQDEKNKSIDNIKEECKIDTNSTDKKEMQTEFNEENMKSQKEGAILNKMKTTNEKIKISEDEYSEVFLNLIENATIPFFVEFLDRSDINVSKFYDFCLLNLAENIKSGYEDGSKIIARICYFLRYAKSHGRSFLIKLNNAKSKRDEIEKDIYEYYLECKEKILSLQDNQ